MTEYEIRPVRPDEVDGVVALTADRIGDEDAAEARIVLEDQAFDLARWTVAVARGAVARGAVAQGAVVSMAVALPGVVRVGRLEMPAANIEFVATAEEHEGRGLVRRQLEWLHRSCRDRQEHVQVIVGIPYFYRRFGYEYAVPAPDYQHIPADQQLPAAGGVRPATEHDLAAIVELQEVAERVADVTFRHTEQQWRWLVQSPVYRTLIVEDGGRTTGMTRVYDEEDQSWMVDTVASDDRALAALIGAARAESGGTVTVYHRPGLSDALARFGSREPHRYSFYLRVDDPQPVLDRLRPVLADRLARSPFADRAGRCLLSFYRSSVSFEYDHGEIGPITTGGPVPAPVAAGGSGVPPDLVATLLFGPMGAAELEIRHADVLLGRQRELMGILFPPQSVDVQTWVPL